MGRNIPSREILSSIHPRILSLAIFVTWVIALVATISSLCGIWSKKSSKSKSSKNEKKIKELTTSKKTQEIPNHPSILSSQKPQNNTNLSSNNTNNEEIIINKPLPLPPLSSNLELKTPKKIHKSSSSSSLQNYMSKASTTRRKLSSSMSMKVSSKIKDKASDFKDKASEFGHRKTKNDDTLWTKRIILGEKCRLPNDDDEVVDPLKHDTLRPQNYYRAMSRSNSFMSQDVANSSLSQDVANSSLSQDEKMTMDDENGKDQGYFDDDDKIL